MLEVDALGITRDGRAIVSGVTFRAGRGERLALMGASGTGKTTVLRAIAGLEPFSAGGISVGGVRLDAGGRTSRQTIDLQCRVGMVFQFHHLFAHLSALHNVWLSPVHAMREPRAQAERRALDLLEKLGVAARAEAMPHELSGGEAQRVAIARALAMNPPVLLMDEPTASLDPERRSELASTVRDLSSEGTTLLIATHDAEFARACADRVLLMDGGRIVGEGRPADVLS